MIAQQDFDAPQILINIAFCAKKKADSIDRAEIHSVETEWIGRSSCLNWKR